MSKTPAVLLISPGILKWTDMDFGLPHLVSMGGYLRHHTGVRVELLDLNYEGGDHSTLLKTVESLGPHLLIGVSCYSSFDYMRVMALARFIKDHLPDVPLVTGGYHASALPEDVVFDGSPFDAVVLGEGEIPMRQIVETLLGGGVLTKQRYGPALIQDLDTLPPYDWSLLDRYWPRAHALGRKFQIYLSRGCPYHCTFCMERSKSGYSWRSYSAGRAVEELERLSARTDLSRWVINIADPLFGFQRAWRREVLAGIIDKGLLPRQYWTLTRSDDLNEEDISLLARARFSIGIGLESGSPTMLAQMQKGNTATRYLGAVRQLARLSHDHGLTWAVNVIVGHPGETPQTLQETAAFVSELFQSTDTTRGWLSVDPFRLYPGSAVHQQRADWSAKYGAKFYAPEWWKSWYDLGFHAQHLDAGRDMPFETRVRAMHATYRPLLLDIADRFVGQDRSVDAVYRNSIRQQAEALSDSRLQHTLAQAGRSHRRVDPQLRIPLGMNLKDPWIRRREMAVRRLLARGVLRSADLIAALLRVAPERMMGPDEAGAVLEGATPPVLAEGLLPVSLGIDVLATGLEALEPEPGQVVADLTGRSAYVGALLSRLVGPSGRVIVNQPLPEDPATTTALEALGNVTVRCVPQDALLNLPEPVDRIWIGAALPRRPALAPMLKPEGRAVVAIGPRFRRQDLVTLRVEAGQTIEQIVARM
ncbi:MAG: radical SAM protein, partial [Myxococcota bacterium]|nr:radical SAM protein [Myxococcota bacterium]